MVHYRPPSKRKDDEIQALKLEVSELHIRADNLEQHSCHTLVQVFGVPVDKSGSTYDKLLHLCNTPMKMTPPLTLEEIKVSHRVGRIEAVISSKKNGETTTMIKPHPIIVKFVSRQTKARVMAMHDNLKKLKSATTTQDAESEPDETNSPEGDDDKDLTRIYPQPIYIADDRTRDKAKLAFTAWGGYRDEYKIPGSIIVPYWSRTMKDVYLQSSSYG